LIEKQLTAVTGDVPALILAGRFDPITPAGWGETSTEILSNSTIFEFPSLGQEVN
jgi:pimeloyl-ACP methyl ester carboxylesterase